MTLFNFKVQFVRYGEYHHNKVNQLIHVIFVPLILFTVQVFLSKVAVSLSTLVGPRIDALVLVFGDSAALLVTLSYALYYVVLHPALGLLCTPVLLLSLFGAKQFGEMSPAQLETLTGGILVGWTALQLSLFLHVTAWVFQIMGHKLFEGRAPAFTKDPLQAVVLAPLFVFCEVLFGLGLFGGLNKTLEQEVEAKVAVWRLAKRKKQN